jgi:phage shock protein A
MEPTVTVGRCSINRESSSEARRRQAEEMANPFVKFWKYLMAAFSSKIDEHADPKVQIQQAIEEAQRAHQALSQQAAAVIGNQRQLEMKLNRQLGEVEKLQASARQALVLADEARTKGDDQKATQFEQAAQSFASQLVTAEQSIEDLKTLHDQALQAAAQAKTAVERNAMVLQNKLAERTKLLSQLEQAKMQEQVSKSLSQMSELAAPGNVPSLEEVRDKIEKRYATAIGSAELAQNSVQGRMLEVQASTTEMAGQARLEQIRASMSGGKVAGQVTSGQSAAPAGNPPSSIQAEIAQRVAQEQKANPQGS